MSDAKKLSVTGTIGIVLVLAVAVGLPHRGGVGHPVVKARGDVSSTRILRSGRADAPQSTDSIAQDDSVLRLTGQDTEDDYPALAIAPNGSIWLVYVEYRPGSPIASEQVQNGRFDSLVTQGHGDRIRLRRFDGQKWHPAIDVTKRGLDIWRPTVTVDGAGNVVVAWAQSAAGNWEIFSRTYSPQRELADRWSRIIRVTNQLGSDFHVVSTTDAKGRVWLAWQGWRQDNFDIHLARLEVSGEFVVVPQIPSSKGNEWSPAITADQQGNVIVAWDTYEQGNYDVRLQLIGEQPRTLRVAGSARFEARPSLVCDLAGRVWIAYEEGDEQWGKDYSTPVEWGRNRGEVDRGFGLYVNRTIRVKCLVDGRLLQPAVRLEQALKDHTKGNISLPRMAVDNNNGLWLMFRRHLRPDNRGGGEAWHSFATRYSGKQWSPVNRLPNSSNLLDNRPALATQPKSVLAVYSGDERTRTQKREQNDLFALALEYNPDADLKPELTPDDAMPAASVPAVHPNEDADVTRMRVFRQKHGANDLRLLRGDFHRHTEYTAHRDGDGLLEDSWRYALDAGQLDWMGNGDHDSGYGHEYHWWQIQKVTELFHNPPGFIAVQSYERSNRFPDGHRIVIVPRRGVRPLPRGSLKGTAEQGTPDTKLLYAYLKYFGGMCASHTSATGMGTDWRDNDPLVEPVVEIFQGCRQNYQSYEHLGAPRADPKSNQFSDGFIWNALAKGYRLGFQASSDHFSTHISYAVVLVKDTSRQSIIDAFKKRHCYGSNDNIVLIVRSGEHLMGDVFETQTRPRLHIQVDAPDTIVRLQVIRNNRYVYTAQPNSSRVELNYTDSMAQPGKQYYYYVRVEQADGSLAWASPMWISFKP